MRSLSRMTPAPSDAPGMSSPLPSVRGVPGNVRNRVVTFGGTGSIKLPQPTKLPAKITVPPSPPKRATTQVLTSIATSPPPRPSNSTTASQLASPSPLKSPAEPPSSESPGTRKRRGSAPHSHSRWEAVRDLFVGGGHGMRKARASYEGSGYEALIDEETGALAAVTGSGSQRASHSPLRSLGQECEWEPKHCTFVQHD